MSVLVSNIQRFSVNDGPGIRTTIFTVGCNLRCPWCANPENLVRDVKLAEKTNNQIRQVEYTTEELYNFIMRDYEYYGDKGGVTFSGGEPLLWSDELIELFDKLKEKRITICVETALGVTTNKIQKVMDYIDYWYIDLKTCDLGKMQMLGLDYGEYVKNVMMVQEKTDSITIRMPLVSGFNIGHQDLVKAREFLDFYKIKKIEFLFVHGLANKKYSLLGRDFNDYSLKTELKNELKRKIVDVMVDYEGVYKIYE